MSSIKDYRLNQKQVHILTLVYKFRFITAPLLAKYRKDSNPSVTNSALTKLRTKGYVGRNYNKSYKLQGRAAVYYLTPKSLNFLKNEHELDPKALHAMYKNPGLSLNYIDRHLEALKIFLAIRQTYPGIFHMFSRTELIKHGYFPDKKPDLYLHRIEPSSKLPNEYLLEIVSGESFFSVKKRFSDYLEHFESGDWEAETKNSYPTLLFVCHDGKTESRLQEHISKVFDNTGIDDLKIFTTSLKALLDTDHKQVWSDVYDPGSPVSL